MNIGVLILFAFTVCHRCAYVTHWPSAYETCALSTTAPELSITLARPSLQIANAPRAFYAFSIITFNIRFYSAQCK